MYYHIIVSRKGQANKIKLSPLTNHKNTTKGTVKGSFDRTNLFQQVEKGFDRLFNYDQPIAESFEFYNTMENGPIADQIKMQEEAFNQIIKNRNIKIILLAEDQVEKEPCLEALIRDKHQNERKYNRKLRESTYFFN